MPDNANHAARDDVLRIQNICKGVIGPDTGTAEYHELYSTMREIAMEISQCDTHRIELAMSFLIADPWSFRSGYVKGKLLRSFRHLGTQLRNWAEPMQVITWNYVDKGGRYEFLELVRLARNFDSDALREGLAERLQSPDERQRYRALRMLSQVLESPADNRLRNAIYCFLLSYDVANPVDCVIPHGSVWTWMVWMLDTYVSDELVEKIRIQLKSSDFTLQLRAMLLLQHLPQQICNESDAETIHDLLLDEQLSELQNTRQPGAFPWTHISRVAQSFYTEDFRSRIDQKLTDESDTSAYHAMNLLCMLHDHEITKREQSAIENRLLSIQEPDEQFWRGPIHTCCWTLRTIGLTESTVETARNRAAEGNSSSQQILQHFQLSETPRTE